MLDVRKLDAPALQAILSGDDRVRTVEVMERAACGDGVASTADRVTLRLGYEQTDTTAPTQLVLKTLLLHPLLRFGLPAILGLATATRALEKLPLIGRSARALLFSLVGFYQRIYPHAPDAMYLTEVRFYRDIRPELELETPRVYGSLFDEGSRQFGILMEDLSLRAARFPNATEEMPLRQVRRLLESLAQLHARFWQSERLSTDLDWVPTRLTGGMFPVFDGIGRELIRYQVESNPFKRELLAPLARSVDELWEALWASQRMLAKGPLTLLHGDPHMGNTYLLADDQAGLLDWQLMVRGHWANDVTYLICTALSTQTRRTEERWLLTHYLYALQHAGVVDPPTEDEAWESYRLAAIWGLVIGWLITPPVNYGVPITKANIARMVTATMDLRSFEAVV